MRAARLLTVDAIINLVLGAVLVVFPTRLVTVWRDLDRGLTRRC